MHFVSETTPVLGTMAYKQERQFGQVFAIFFTIVAFWPLWPLWPRPGPNLYWLIAAGASLGFGLLWPRVLAPLNRAWLALGHVLGWINSKIILGFIFFVIVTPTALAMKALGRDLLSRRLHCCGSYWVKRDLDWTSVSMRDQF